MMSQATSKTAVEWALEHADNGIPVFPLYGIRDGHCTCRRRGCNSPGKHPRTTNGFKDATTDQGQIRMWWQRWPDANIGGATDQFVVLDVDPKHKGDASLGAFEDERGKLPRGAVALTGLVNNRRGQHLYYRANGEQVKSRARVLPGVDVRAQGGYVVLPGSLHASGATYEWDGTPEFDETPRSLLNLLATDVQPNDHQAGAVEKSGLAELLNVPPAEGERNEWLTRVAGYYARLLDRRDDFEHHVLAASLLAKPPMSRVEALAVAESIWSREDRQRAKKVADRIEAYRLNEEAKRQFQAEEAEKHGGELTFVDAFKAIHDDDAQIDWVIPGFIAARDKVVIAAPPKSYKTWLALSLARNIALAEPALGEQEWTVAEPQSVLFVQEEGSSQAWVQRLRQTLGRDGDSSEAIWCAVRRGFSLLNERHLSRLIEVASEKRARAIFLDPLQRMQPGVDENSAAETGPVWDSIHRIATQTGAAVVVLHHAKKGEGRPSMDSIRGSSRVAGEVDLMLILRRVERGQLELYLDGRDLPPREDEHEGNFRVDFDPDAPHDMRLSSSGITIAGSAGDTKSTITQVLREAKAAGEQPLTTSEVLARVNEICGRKLNKSTVSRPLNALAKGGIARRGAATAGRDATWEWIE